MRKINIWIPIYDDSCFNSDLNKDPFKIKQDNCQELGGSKCNLEIIVLKLSEDVSGVDFSVTCVSCRKDEPDSGPLTTFFFNSTQSKHKVKITFLAALPALRIAALWPVNHFRIQIP